MQTAETGPGNMATIVYKVHECEQRKEEIAREREEGVSVRRSRRVNKDTCGMLTFQFLYLPFECLDLSLVSFYSFSEFIDFCLILTNNK